MQEKVLESRQRVLGEDHPNTLTSMNNLAWTLYAQGNLSEAREMQKQVLDRRRAPDEQPKEKYIEWMIK